MLLQMQCWLLLVVMLEHFINTYKEVKQFYDSVTPEKEGWYIDKDLSFNTMLWLIRFIDKLVEDNILDVSDSEKEYLKNEYRYITSISKFSAGVVSV